MTITRDVTNTEVITEQRVVTGTIDGGTTVTGTRVVTGTGTVEMWQRLLQFEGEIGSVTNVAWSPDGTMLAAGLEEGFVLVWDVATLELVTTLDVETRIVNSVAWTTDGSQLAAGAEGGLVLVWDVETWQNVHRVEINDVGEVSSISWSADGVTIAIAFTSGFVFVGEVTAQEPTAILQGPTDSITSVAWSPDGSQIGAGSLDGSLWVWSTETWEVVTVFEESPGVLSFDWGSSEGVLVYGLASGAVHVGDVATGEVLDRLAVEAGSANSVAWERTRDLVAVGTEDGSVLIWDVEADEIAATLEADAGSINGVAWSTDGSQLAASAVEGLVLVWNAQVMAASAEQPLVDGETSGYYRLQTMWLEPEDKCLEGNQVAADAVLGGAAFMNDCADATGQMWKLTPAGEGYVQLQTALLEEQEMCLEGNQVAADAFLGGGAFMADCQDVAGQLWKLVESDVDGYYRLQTAFLEAENMCLESNRVTEDAYLGGAAYMDDCQDVSGQLWKLDPIAPEDTSP